MGGAIRQNFLQNNIAKSNIVIIDPNSELADFAAVEDAKNNSRFAAYDVVIFAIKPQGSEAVLEEFYQTKLFHQNTIFISILAGKKIEFFEGFLGSDKKIIRLMPNLPITIGEGISAYFCNKNLQNNEEIELVNLFGQNLKLEQEDQINQVTAISGSGPAYLFLFAKSLILSAQKMGQGENNLNEEIARKLVFQTLFGASKMLLNESDIDNLIKSVTSKGGTTASALEVFNNKENSLEDLVDKAVQAAFKRASKL